MIRGHKSFNRLTYAFTNALTDTLTWLFTDLRSTTISPTSPITAHQPFIRDVEHQILQLDAVKAPSFPTSFVGGDEIAATELFEWISLVLLDSPRVREGDGVDPYLCRYSVPDLGVQVAVTETGGQDDTASAMAVTDLVRVRWHGFMSAAFVSNVFTAAVKATSGPSEETWFALRAQSFNGRGYVILKPGDGNAMTWEHE